MKYLLITVFLFASADAFPQPQSQRYEYCIMYVQTKMLSRKVTIALDFGEEQTLFKDTRVRDEETGKVSKFNSEVDAINYMASQGWEIDKFYVQIVSGVEIRYYILRIPVTL